MINKLKGYLGLAARGRYLKYGEEALLSAHPYDVIFLAQDASELTKEKVYQRQKKDSFQIIECFSKDELGTILGKNEIAIILVTNRSLAKQIKRIISMKGE